jgi:hypothetical protein
MDGAFGTRDKRELQRMMQLFTKLWGQAQEAGVRLPPGEEQELMALAEKMQRMLYGPRR